jgi:hypothetical protein
VSVSPQRTRRLYRIQSRLPPDIFPVTCGDQDSGKKEMRCISTITVNDYVRFEVSVEIMVFGKLHRFGTIHCFHLRG